MCPESGHLGAAASADMQISSQQDAADWLIYALHVPFCMPCHK